MTIRLISQYRFSYDCCLSYCDYFYNGANLQAINQVHKKKGRCAKVVLNTPRKGIDQMAVERRVNNILSYEIVWRRML